MKTTVRTFTQVMGRDAVVGDGPYARGEVATWVGAIMVAASERGITGVRLPDWHGDQGGLPRACSAVQTAVTIERDGPAAAQSHLRAALDQLAAYFAGERREFTVALDLAGGPFSRRAWDEVARVPFGESRSYQEIARALGAPNATRAVGAANGANPVAPLVPCHRIVGAAGQLTGYGPGLPLKHALLVFEDAIPAGADDYSAWIERVRGRFGTGEVYLGVRALGTCCRPTCARGAVHHLRPNRVFGTLEDAEAAGFKPCSACQAQ